MRILVYGAGVIGANLAADLTAGGKDVTLPARGAWADTLEEKGLVIDAVFLAADVLHYLTRDAVEALVRAMAERFPGALFVFDFVSEAGLSGGNAQVRMTDNATSLTFSLENAERELPAMSPRIARVVQKSYLEGYPVEGVRYSWLTRLYIKSKRNKFFIAHVEFKGK